MSEHNTHTNTCLGELHRAAEKIGDAQKALEGINLHAAIKRLSCQVSELTQRAERAEAALEETRTELDETKQEKLRVEQKLQKREAYNQRLQSWIANMEESDDNDLDTTPITQANNKRKLMEEAGEPLSRAQRPKSARTPQGAEKKNLHLEDWHMLEASVKEDDAKAEDDAKVVAAGAAEVTTAGSSGVTAEADAEAKMAVEDEAKEVGTLREVTEVATLERCDTLVSGAAEATGEASISYDLLVASKQIKGRTNETHDLLLALSSAGKLRVFDSDKLGDWKEARATEVQRDVLLDVDGASDPRLSSSLTRDVSEKHMFACVNGSIYFRHNYFFCPTEDTAKLAADLQRRVDLETSLPNVASNVTQVICHQLDKNLIALLGLGSVTILHLLMYKRKSETDSSAQDEYEYQELIKPSVKTSLTTKAPLAVWTTPSSDRVLCDYLVISHDSFLRAYMVRSNAHRPTKPPPPENTSVTREEHAAYKAEVKRLKKKHDDEVERWLNDARENHHGDNLLQSDGNVLHLKSFGQPRILLCAPPDEWEKGLGGIDLVLLVWPHRLQLASVGGPIQLLKHVVNESLTNLTAARHFMWDCPKSRRRPCWLVGSESGEVTVLNSKLEKLWQRRLVQPTADLHLMSPEARRLSALECRIVAKAEADPDSTVVEPAQSAAASQPCIFAGFASGCLAAFHVDMDSLSAALQECE
eukprot:CAMPEP_0119301718 /NCGR_PEP_ID=MMETSP1333-20130426/3455_1 /TAXON_ID=418940 /ORGANISM="Scyphosphaera apsteinii, Strain RCC1455" /LENGTH=700 /DNA_ID=CAMNT_0007303875 /DNA_START=109 /DNA_END=2211 /DNA_ORIENTATION=-